MGGAAHRGTAVSNPTSGSLPGSSYWDIMIGVARIFLSYASADKPAVRQIAAALRAAGHNPWLDEDEILVGESIPAAVERGLRDADFVALCLSEAAAKRGWVEAERDATLLQQFTERKERILPLRLEEVTPPYLVASIAYVDLFPDEQAFKQGIAQLARSIESHAGRRSTNGDTGGASDHAVADIRPSGDGTKLVHRSATMLRDARIATDTTSETIPGVATGGQVVIVETNFGRIVIGDSYPKLAVRAAITGLVAGVVLLLGRYAIPVAIAWFGSVLAWLFKKREPRELPAAAAGSVARSIVGVGVVAVVAVSPALIQKVITASMASNRRLTALPVTGEPASPLPFHSARNEIVDGPAPTLNDIGGRATDSLAGSRRDGPEPRVPASPAGAASTRPKHDTITAAEDTNKPAVETKPTDETTKSAEKMMSTDRTEPPHETQHAHETQPPTRSSRPTRPS
jgi:hypothetical protein